MSEPSEIRLEVSLSEKQVGPVNVVTVVLNQDGNVRVFMRLHGTWTEVLPNFDVSEITDPESLISLSQIYEEAKNANQRQGEGDPA